MALISNAKGRRITQSPSGYTRLFGNNGLGHLMSRVQGTVITCGTELETLIWERSQQIDNLDEFLERIETALISGLWLARKQQIIASKIISSKENKPDFLIFDVLKKNCSIVEVKDGDQFDTKKSLAEHTTLHNFSNDVSHSLTFKTKVYLCSFNARSHEEIFEGLKGKFSYNELLTGEELCNMLGISYLEIIKIRSNDQQANLEYFINELLKIDIIKLLILKILKVDKQS